MRENWPHYLASIVGILVGVASFVLLLTEGVPGAEEASGGRQVTLSHTKSSGCPEKCSKPEHTETRVSTPAPPAADPSLIDKAIDNDAGVLVIRLLVALLAALTTATTLERLLRAPNASAEKRNDAPPDDRGNPARPLPKDNPGPGSGAADAAETRKRRAEEETRLAEEAKAAERRRKTEEEAEEAKSEREEREELTVRKRLRVAKREADERPKPELELCIRTPAGKPQPPATAGRMVTSAPSSICVSSPCWKRMSSPLT